jgi:uroporphyrin-III C-methyltransferase/precorrin-2 dehydrogenase/sirohydrochlorin ferrochelatase
MKYFPVSLNLSKSVVTLIGGGEIATRRVESLISCGASLTVIAPNPSNQIRSSAESGEILLLERPYASGDLGGSDLVLTATDDPVVNAACWEEAQAEGIPINVADDPERCDFIIPAVVERGDLSIAISTNGKSPALAARLRRRLSGMLGFEYGRLLEVLDGVRRRLKATGLNFDQKKRILYRLIDSDLRRLVRESDDDRISALVDTAITEGVRDPAKRESVGKVFIVGAGPGDPGLITLRGLECLNSADVVLHDRLIDPRLLDEARAGAQIVNVGKRIGEQESMQRFIHENMVEHAREGRIVCRLKGGDPFVFGRGGEEARVLVEADIPFEIIPGVTSAIAAPAAAGIPVTHRDSAHSFMVMTGSRANNAAEEEWAGAASLIEGGGTLVVLMGLAHLERITQRLVHAGCRGATPSAVVSSGTLHNQVVRIGTLDDIRSRSEGVSSPAVLVFGEVVREREALEALRSAIPEDPRK